jgi:uncharacterized membrane protein
MDGAPHFVCRGLRDSPRPMTEPAPNPLACPDCAFQMPPTAVFCPGCGRFMQSPTRAQDKVGLLSENVAGALSYLTFIPAAFFLLRPPYNRNRFVRLHSVQSLMLWLACAATVAALRLAGLLIVHIPILGPLLITLLYGVAALASVILWAVLIVKAFQGEAFQLPLLGDLADHYADPL